MAAIDDYSTVPLYLDTTCKGNPISHGTGFLVRRNGDLYLVSNWHVFAGRDPSTGRPMHSAGAVPDELRIFLHHGPLGRWAPAGFALYAPDGTAKWKMHPSGQAVDVAAARIVLPTGVVGYPINERNTTPDMEIAVADDVFVIGFPLALTPTGYFPVWKRASVATEPAIDAMSQPCFLVDTATREGMSGSPVIARRDGMYKARGKGLQIKPGVFSCFLGVYSGRLGADHELKAQLGIVWRESVIEEILSNEVAGDFVLI